MLRPEAVLSEEEEEEEPVDSLEDFHSRLRSLWSRPKTRRMSGGKKKKKLKTRLYGYGYAIAMILHSTIDLL